MAEKKILQCSKLTAKRRLIIAFAESATVGWLCSEFALTPESGQVLQGGITCYDASLKETLLKVPHELIEEFTPESQEVTDELAKRLGALIPSDIQVGVTGLTTPGASETIEKLVDTMFVSTVIKGRLIGIRKVFKGSWEEIIHQTITAAAEMLIRDLSQNNFQM